MLTREQFERLVQERGGALFNTPGVAGQERVVDRFVGGPSPGARTTSSSASPDSRLAEGKRTAGASTS